MMDSIQEGSVIGIFLSSLPQGADKLAVSMILAVGGLLIMQGKMTIGDFIAFQSLMAGFSGPRTGNDDAGRRCPDAGGRYEQAGRRDEIQEGYCF